jgi:hypothetical protein
MKATPIRSRINPKENLCGCLVQTRRGYRWWYLDDQYGLGPSVYVYCAAMIPPAVHGAVQRHTRRFGIARIARIRFRADDGSYSEPVEVLA